jgi:hypothetical protein
MTGEDETLTARIVRIYPDADALLLAPMGMSEGQPPMFLSWEWHEQLTEGDCLVLTYRGGMVEEQSPYLNAPVFRPKKTVSVTTDGKRFDNLASIYLNALIDINTEELMGFGTPKIVSVDLTQTSLPENERAAFRLAIEEAVGVTPLSLTVAELQEQGYMSGGAPGYYYMEDGYVLSVKETADQSTDTYKTFRIGRWWAGLGAMHRIGNITERDENGVWSPYVKGKIRRS